MKKRAWEISTIVYADSKEEALEDFRNDTDLYTLEIKEVTEKN